MRGSLSTGVRTASSHKNLFSLERWCLYTGHTVEHASTDKSIQRRNPQQSVLNTGSDDHCPGAHLRSVRPGCWLLR